MINFDKYNTDNPKIWAEFVRLSFEAKKKGFKRYSAKGIFELIRWNTKIEGNDGFKLNNNYHAYYSRKMMEDYPEFKGFFEIRKVNKTTSENKVKIDDPNAPWNWKKDISEV
jgi:hypothetical protein